MCKIYLSQFSNIFVQIAKCMCPNGMAELLDERVGEIETVQVAEVKEQLHQQLGQVEAQLAAQKKVSKS